MSISRLFLERKNRRVVEQKTEMDMARMNGKPTAGSVALIALAVCLLGVVFYMFPPWQVATDSPEKIGHDSMNPVPVAIWWAGSIALAVAIIYATWRTRHRSAADVETTEEGTKRLYREEDKAERG